MPWSTLNTAGAWSAFFGLLLWLLWKYSRGKIISEAEHLRRAAALTEERDQAVATERRIGTYHEKRAEVAEAARDRAHEALIALTQQLPEALRQAKAGSA